MCKQSANKTPNCVRSDSYRIRVKIDNLITFINRAVVIGGAQEIQLDFGMPTRKGCFIASERQGEIFRGSGNGGRNERGWVEHRFARLVITSAVTFAASCGLGITQKGSLPDRPLNRGIRARVIVGVWLPPDIYNGANIRRHRIKSSRESEE